MKIRVGFAAGAALLVGVGLMPGQPPANRDVRVLSNGNNCGLIGTATSDAGKALNRLKNRYAAPTAADIDPNVSLAAMLAPGDDVDRFDTTKGAKVVGFVIAVKVGGKETCNCKANAQVDRDTHIELALSNDAPETQRVIVEVTPRLRDIMRDQNIDWSTQTLKRTGAHGIKGKWVEVTGWLMFDAMHINEAENTRPGHQGNWRATCWELHPVTGIEVLDGPPDTTPDFNPGLMSAFHRTHAMQLNRDPAKKQAQEARNKALMEKFTADELDERPR